MSFASSRRSSAPVDSVTASLPYSSRPRAARRTSSTARLRAAVTIHPGGLEGIPRRGQCRRAATNASCTASSARVRSPNTRARVPPLARALPGRRVRPRPSACVPGCSCPRLLGVNSPGGPERSHLNRMVNGLHNLVSPRQRLIETLSVDDVEAADVLLGFGEWPIGDDLVEPGALVDNGSRVGPVQCTTEHERPRRLHFVLQRAHPLHERPHVLRRHWGAGNLAISFVHGKQVLVHHTHSSAQVERAPPASVLMTNKAHE